ncbi:MAG: leucyl/phenylalanyl-tRNA--protein transferase, partial [Pirellulaceae bacterium]
SDFHASTRLTRRIRRNEFEFTWNTCFEQVVFECSQPRRADSGIWIIDELLDVYSKMHAAGHAYSIETWQDGQLVGGVFGVVVGDFYSGESMFHTRPDASKAAIVELVRQLTTDGITWLDIQLPSEHMTRMGAKQIERSEFLLRLRQQNFDR